jgi:hypothetical protein
MFKVSNTYLVWGVIALAAEAYTLWTKDGLFLSLIPFCSFGPYQKSRPYGGPFIAWNEMPCAEIITVGGGLAMMGALTPIWMSFPSLHTTLG